ncbi:MAG: hypothetical protein ACSLFB_05445 [Acidimicrobiales bacterium]
MITTGAKFWFGLTFFTLVATVVYFMGSGGEEFGSVVLVAAVIASFIVGTTCAGMRDGNLQTPGGRTLALGTSPRRSAAPAPWPAFGAVGAAVALVGLAGGNALLYVGIGIMGVVLVEWMVQGWAERSTTDSTQNQELRNRIMQPFEFPVLAAVTIAVVVLSFSRVLLALSKTGSTVIAMVLATVILAVAFVVAARPRISSTLLSAFLVLSTLGLIAGGIASAVVGEREIVKHEVEATHP